MSTGIIRPSLGNYFELVESPESRGLDQFGRLFIVMGQRVIRHSYRWLGLVQKGIIIASVPRFRTAGWRGDNNTI